MTPYRIVVCARGWTRGKLHKGRGADARGAYTEIRPASYGFVAWNPDHAVEAGRLPGSGSFVWPGLHAAYRHAARLLRLSTTRQVQVRTNQDRLLYVWNRDAAGRISGYWAKSD